MDFPLDAHNSGVKERGFRRHSANQIAKLEEMFNEYPHPDESRRLQLSEELGIDPQQVKFWFQNKRTKLKTLSERFDNYALRLENENMQSDNFILRKTLRNARCLTCRGPIFGEEDSSMQSLRLENALLRREYEGISKLINPMLTPTPRFSFDPSRGGLLNQNVEIPAPDQHIPTLVQHIPAHNLQVPVLHHHIPVVDQDIPILTPPGLDQHIPVLDQDIQVVTPAHDQDFTALISALDQDIISSLDQDTPSLDLDFDAVHGISDDFMLPQPTDAEKVLMNDIANTAMEELKRLLCINEPFWFRSLVDERFILQRGSYEKIFHRGHQLKRHHARIESSKDSRIVNMSGTKLVNMLLNSDKWVDLFPTIITKAQTIQVIESGGLESRNGALQLMNAEIHILSPLVPTREFVFLRYCKQVEVGAWVIADVSFNSSEYNSTLCRAWRFPSGCLIQEITNESCRVSWVEHVEVDDKIQTDRLFREVICENNSYGAEKWLFTLERMCERIACTSLENPPNYEVEGVIRLPEERRSVMQLAHRMVKIFCRTLDMSDNMDFPHFSNGGVRVCVRNNREPGVPNGTIVSAASSFWLPVSPQNVFDFLKDNNRRVQWDVLCYGNPVHQIQSISSQTHPGNCTSIIRPFVPKESDMLILQESYIDPLGSLLIYAPLDVATLNVPMRGEDSSLLPLLPSGFTISGDGRSNAVAGGKLGGSLITLAYQIMACSASKMEQLDMESVATVTTLVTSTVEKIKVALNCSNLD